MSDYSNTFGGAAKDAAESTILGADHDTQYDAIATMSATKADKSVPSAANNVAGLDVNGNLTDSGITTDGSGTATFTGVVIGSDAVQASVHGTAQNTTSGTSKDFTSIPSWVKKITVTWAGVSTSSVSTGVYVIRVGTGGTPASTGYNGVLGRVTTAGTGLSISTTAIPVGRFSTTDTTCSGSAVLTLLDPTTNQWVCHGVSKADATGTSNDNTSSFSGDVTLAGELDTVRFLTSGSETFDAGTINILYE